MDYRTIYQKAAQKGGWSRDKLDKTTKWGDFYELVKQRLHGDEVVLDIGAAEGNHFMRLSKHIKKGVGIDLESAMIKLAQENKRKRGIKNIVFKCMDANNLQFPANSFDVVTNKHTLVNFKEIFRVLKPGGWFLTQQVYETDKLNLKQAFGRGQNHKRKAGTLLEQYKKQAKQAGFRSIKSKISNISYYFKSEEKLIDFLNKAPTVPEFGRDNDYGILEKFIKKNRTPKGIESNTSRFLLEMRK